MTALAAEGGLAPLANELSITIGGIAVPPEDIFYAGAAPCCTDTTGERRKARLLRRWITLLPAGWLPPEKRPSASLYRRRSPWRALPSWIEGSHAQSVIRNRRGWTGHPIFSIGLHSARRVKNVNARIAPC